MRPIPDSVWQRLAALDGRFDLALERRRAAPPRGVMESGRNFERCWVVRVIDPADPRATVTCEAASLAEALREAVECVEQKLRPPPAAYRAATGTPRQTH